MITFTDATVGFIGRVTKDGRLLRRDMTLTLALPWPLLSERTTDGEAAAAATREDPWPLLPGQTPVGQVTNARIEGDRILASGHMFDVPEARRAARALAAGELRPALDVDDIEYQYECDGQPVIGDQIWDQPDSVLVCAFTVARVVAVTLCSNPAWDDTEMILQ